MDHKVHSPPILPVMVQVEGTKVRNEGVELSQGSSKGWVEGVFLFLTILLWFSLAIS